MWQPSERTRVHNGRRVIKNKDEGAPMPTRWEQMVPQQLRMQPDHRIYWTKRSSRFADQFNSATTILNQACLRRWLEFIGGTVPPKLSYATCYRDIPTVTPNPSRYWLIVDEDDTALAGYTNVAEAWFICLGAKQFNEQKLSLIYIDRTV